MVVFARDMVEANNFALLVVSSLGILDFFLFLCDLLVRLTIMRGMIDSALLDSLPSRT